MPFNLVRSAGSLSCVDDTTEATVECKKQHWAQCDDCNAWRMLDAHGYKQLQASLPDSNKWAHTSCAAWPHKMSSLTQS